MTPIRYVLAEGFDFAMAITQALAARGFCLLMALVSQVLVAGV